MFETRVVNSAVALDDLREKIRRLEGAAAGFTETLPGGGLRVGGAYRVTDYGQLLDCLAEVSSDGAWVAVVGVPDLGILAASERGINLDRTILVPEPGEAWLEATAALIDVVPLVAIKPASQVSEATASRLAARLRKRGAALVSLGPWPRARKLPVVEWPRSGRIGTVEVATWRAS